MSKTFVSVTITGHVTKDPELRITPHGREVTEFTVIANDRRYNYNQGEWVETLTMAIRVTAWGQLAEAVVDSIRKGSKVTVTGGRLEADAYLGRDGQPKAVLLLTASTVSVDLWTQTVTVHRPTTTTDEDDNR